MSTPAPPQPPQSGVREQSLIRGLGISGATALVMGSMIGSGIFIVPAGIARTVRAPGLFLLVWVVAGFMTLAAALNYGELAAALPRAGGQYVYLREGLHPLFGFLYGWTFFLVIQTGTIAAVAIAFATYAGTLFPAISNSHFLFQIAGHPALAISTQQVVAVVCIILLTWSNARGLRTGAMIQTTFTAAKVFALAALIIVGLFVARNAAVLEGNLRRLWTVAPPAPPGAIFSLFFVALVGALFSSDAWNNVTFTAGEVVNPRRTLPLSLALGTLAVTALYLLTNLAYLCVLPLRGDPRATTIAGRGIAFASADRVATAMMGVAFGHAAAGLMAAAILISTFGCNNGLILAGARVYYAMAKDRLFFRRVERLNSRTHVPAAALWVQCLWACLLCLTGSYNRMLEYVMFAVVLFYILTIAALFRLRRVQRELERPYRALGYPWLAIAYLALAVCFDGELLVREPRSAGAGLLLVLLGVPVYGLWRRGRTGEAAAGA